MCVGSLMLGCLYLFRDMPGFIRTWVTGHLRCRVGFGGNTFEPAYGGFGEAALAFDLLLGLLLQAA